MSAEFGHTPAVVISHQERDAYLQFARLAVRAAGEEILPYFRSGVQVTNKLENGGFDPVTLADQAGERAIREAIERTYPEHGIFGEEYGFQAGNGLTWVIDPIDGTRAFMTGMLHWGVLLALFDGESPVIGAMYQPYTDELFSGDGTSAWLERGGSGSRWRPVAVKKLPAPVSRPQELSGWQASSKASSGSSAARASSRKWAVIVTSLVCWLWVRWT